MALSLRSQCGPSPNLSLSPTRTPSLIPSGSLFIIGPRLLIIITLHILPSMRSSHACARTPLVPPSRPLPLPTPLSSPPALFHDPTVLPPSPQPSHPTLPRLSSIPSTALPS